MKGKFLNKAKEGWCSVYARLFLNQEVSIPVKSKSIAFGVFMAILPVWGFQLIIGMPLAILFRLNKTIFFIAIHISIFPLMPLFWIASLITGNLLMGKPLIMHHWQHLTLNDVKAEGLSFFLGGTVLAILCGLLSYVISYAILHTRKRIKFAVIAK